MANGTQPYPTEQSSRWVVRIPSRRDAFVRELVRELVAFATSSPNVFAIISRSSSYRSERSAPIVGTSVSTSPRMRPGSDPEPDALPTPAEPRAAGVPSSASRFASACRTPAQSAAAVLWLSPTATNVSYPAASATAAKSPACASNPTRATSASSSASEDALAAADSATPSSHASAPALSFESARLDARAPNTAVGMSAGTSAKSHAIARMSQCRPCPETAPKA